MSELQQRRDAAIARLDAAIAGLEDQAIRRLLDALLASYDAVEGRIQRIYNRESSQGAEFLLKRQLLIQDDLRVMLEALDVSPDVRAELRGPIRDAMATADDYARELILQSAAAQKIENYRLEARSVSSVPAAAIADQVSRGWDRLKNYNTQAKERIIQVVSMGLAQGLSWRKTASALRQQVGQFASDAETVARTEILSANNAQIKRTIAANGFGYGQWIATRDDRSCPICMARHMHVYRLENIVIPAHVRCRCFLAPWDPSFERAGVWDAERDRAAFRDGLKILQDAGRSPSYGKVSGFEKAAGMTEPPKAYWSPREDG